MTKKDTLQSISPKRSRRMIHIVANHHVHWDFLDSCAHETETDSWKEQVPVTEQYRKSFKRHYRHTCFISRIRRSWGTPRRNTYVRHNEKVELPASYGEWRIQDSNRPSQMPAEQAFWKAQVPPTAISSRCPSGICCDWHPGITTEDIERYPICFRGERSLVEINETSNDV